MGNVFYVVLIHAASFVTMDLMAQNFYFSSPRESVEITSQLLLDENWEKLSAYYYLENTNSQMIDSIKNGSYFIRNKRPEVAHPGEFWKYKKPFHPSFNYLSHSENTGDTTKVNVNLEIDQGGGMIQEGMSSFYLLKSKHGYQLLP